MKWMIQRKSVLLIVVKATRSVWLPFEPSNATESWSIVFKFTTYQLLVISNIKHFASSTPFMQPIITESHCHKSFFIVVEADSGDAVFTTIDSDFYSCDLYGWVEDVTLMECRVTSFHILIIAKSEAESISFRPLYFCDLQFF